MKVWLKLLHASLRNIAFFIIHHLIKLHRSPLRKQCCTLWHVYDRNQILSTKKYNDVRLLWSSFESSKSYLKNDPSDWCRGALPYREVDQVLSLFSTFSALDGYTVWSLAQLCDSSGISIIILFYQIRFKSNFSFLSSRHLVDTVLS